MIYDPDARNPRAATVREYVREVIWKAVCGRTV